MLLLDVNSTFKGCEGTKRRARQCVREQRSEGRQKRTTALYTSGNNVEKGYLLDIDHRSSSRACHVSPLSPCVLINGREVN